MKKPNGLESQVQKILQKNNLRYIREYYIGNYPVDFYLKEYNLSIQIDGCWVHFCKKCCKDKKTYARQIFTRRRDKACNMYHKYSKVNILRIKECQLSSAEDLIFIAIRKIILGEKLYA